MSQRITYHITKDNSTLRELLIKHYTAFRTWFLDAHEDSIEEYNEALGTDLLIDFLEENEAIDRLEEIDQNILDELSSEFIASYCDYGGGTKLLKLLNPWMSKERYEESTRLVRNKLDLESVRIWNYLINGRSLKNDNEFIAKNAGYQVAYWKPEEWTHLEKSIRRKFGGNPAFSGIEYVIQMIESLPNRYVDVIIGIG